MWVFIEYEFDKKDYCDLFLGFKCEGEEHYPDTTKKFVNGVNNLLKASDLGRIKVVTPFINKDKEEIIAIGDKLNVPFEKKSK